MIGTDDSKAVAVARMGIDREAVADMGGQRFRFYYTNYKGENEWRRAAVHSVFYGSSPYHQGSQWFVEAMDLDKMEMRNFAMRDMTQVEKL